MAGFQLLSSKPSQASSHWDLNPSRLQGGQRDIESEYQVHRFIASSAENIVSSKTMSKDALHKGRMPGAGLSNGFAEAVGDGKRFGVAKSGSRQESFHGQGSYDRGRDGSPVSDESRGKNHHNYQQQGAVELAVGQISCRRKVEHVSLLQSRGESYGAVPVARGDSLDDLPSSNQERRAAPIPKDQLLPLSKPAVKSFTKRMEFLAVPDCEKDRSGRSGRDEDEDPEAVSLLMELARGSQQSPSLSPPPPASPPASPAKDSCIRQKRSVRRRRETWWLGPASPSEVKPEELEEYKVDEVEMKPLLPKGRVRKDRQSLENVGTQLGTHRDDRHHTEEVEGKGCLKNSGDLKPSERDCGETHAGGKRSKQQKRRMDGEKGDSKSQGRKSRKLNVEVVLEEECADGDGAGAKVAPQQMVDLIVAVTSTNQPVVQQVVLGLAAVGTKTMGSSLKSTQNANVNSTQKASLAKPMRKVIPQNPTQKVSQAKPMQKASPVKPTLKASPLKPTLRASALKSTQKASPPKKVSTSKSTQKTGPLQFPHKASPVNFTHKANPSNSTPKASPPESAQKASPPICMGNGTPSKSTQTPITKGKEMGATKPKCRGTIARVAAGPAVSGRGKGVEHSLRVEEVERMGGGGDGASGGEGDGNKRGGKPTHQVGAKKERITRTAEGPGISGVPAVTGLCHGVEVRLEEAEGMVGGDEDKGGAFVGGGGGNRAGDDACPSELAHRVCAKRKETKGGNVKGRETAVFSPAAPISEGLKVKEDLEIFNEVERSARVDGEDGGAAVGEEADVRFGGNLLSVTERETVKRSKDRRVASREGPDMIARDVATLSLNEQNKGGRKLVRAEEVERTVGGDAEEGGALVGDAAVVEDNAGVNGRPKRLRKPGRLVCGDDTATREVGARTPPDLIDSMAANGVISGVVEVRGGEVNVFLGTSSSADMGGQRELALTPRRLLQPTEKQLQNIAMRPPPKRTDKPSQAVETVVDSVKTMAYASPWGRRLYDAMQVFEDQKQKIPVWREVNLEGVHPKAVIGRSCKIYWPLDKDWYPGAIHTYNHITGKHRVDYEDDENEWLLLAQERVKLQLLPGDFLWERQVKASGKGSGEEFLHGDVVWGKVKGFPSWPALILDEEHAEALGIEPSASSQVALQFFGSFDFARLDRKNLKSLMAGIRQKVTCSQNILKEGLEQVERYLLFQELPPPMASSLILEEESSEDEASDEPAVEEEEAPPLPAEYRPVNIEWKHTDRCCVCDKVEEYTHNLILQCDKCRMMVHMNCYGEDEYPDGDLWLCDLCKPGAPKYNPVCCLCPVTGGALKRTTDGRWAHIVCGIWVPEAYNAQGGSKGITINVEPVNKNRWKLLCSLCKIKHGVCIQCAEKRCIVAFHPLCARGAGLGMEVTEKLQKKKSNKRKRPTDPAVDNARDRDEDAGREPAGAEEHQLSPRNRKVRKVENAVEDTAAATSNPADDVLLLSWCRKHKSPKTPVMKEAKLTGPDTRMDETGASCSDYVPPVNPSGSARTEPYDWRRRGRREPEAVAAFQKKRNFVENVPYIVSEFRGLGNSRPPPRQGRSGNLWTYHWAKTRECGRGGPSKRKAIATEGEDEREQKDGAGSCEDESKMPVLSASERFRMMRSTLSRRLTFGKSNIHGWGVFTKKRHRKGDMVIEYAGETVRPVVADMREARLYDSLVGAGTYIFRVDEERVVDATHKGSIAHLINHACEPNCYSRVVAANGEDHIIIFAKRDLKEGEELTYDYRFRSMDDMLKCNCGSPGCRGFVNLLDDDEDESPQIRIPLSQLKPWHPSDAPPGNTPSLM